eukprot:scaffold76295_cov41-Prasinocladus_malaysianus.AAC.1
MAIGELEEAKATIDSPAVLVRDLCLIGGQELAHLRPGPPAKVPRLLERLLGSVACQSSAVDHKFAGLS